MQAVIDDLTRFGLQRIDTIIGPAIAQMDATLDDLEQRRDQLLAAINNVGDLATQTQLTGAIAAEQAARQAAIAAETSARQAADAALQAAIENVGLPVLAYDQRAQLRTMAYADGKQAIVRDLGLFVHRVGSTEPDDGMTCFATSTGRWLLEAPHWDVVDAFLAPEMESLQLDKPSWFTNCVLFGTATCGIASVAATSQAAFTGTVTGAAVGDRVIVSPPAMIGTDAASNARLAYHAWVSAANTVTVAIVNPSASSASISTAAQGAWQIAVIKP
ncbi:MAG: hypothetical protein NZ694_00565 [Tepidimonas sp.]|nr:hypothetical protein [Tepidimonas sp.]